MINKILQENKIWYEVFISNKQGTRTLDTFDTLKEARVFKQNFTENWLGIDNWKGTLHIDKWQNIDNPIYIGKIL